MRGTLEADPQRAAGAVTLAMLLGLAGLAWLYTYHAAGAMGAMTIGAGAQMGAPLFLTIWVVMVIAMMLPVVAPMILAHRLVVSRRGLNPLLTLVFAGGYLVVWCAFGVVPTAAWSLLRGVTFTGPWTTLLPAAVLFCAGVYQLTPVKASCARSCRSPLHFLMTHDFRGGWGSPLLAGLTHGALCLGCCWALMAVLAVVGLMNLAWMAILTLVFVAERNLPARFRVNQLVAAASIVLAVAVALVPGFLNLISGGGAPAQMPGAM